MQVSPPIVEREGADATLQSGGLYWSGQEIGVAIPESINDADTVELRRYSSDDARAGSLVREFNLDTDRALEIPTPELDGRYLLVPAGNRSQAFEVGSDGVATDLVDPRNALFEVAEQSLRVEWGQDRITTGDDDVSLDIRSNRARYNLKVSADDLDYDDLESLFRSGGAADNPDPYTDRQPFAVDGVVHDAYADDDELVIRGFSDDSLTADFTQIDAGSYSFTFEVTDTGVTSGAPVGDEEMNEDLPEVEPDPAFFNLTGFDPASTTVAPGNPLTVSATVTNIGGTAATQTVELRIDEDPIATEEISLDPDESRMVSFDIETPDEPGRYVHSVHTTDTSVAGELIIEPSEAEPEPGSEPESDPEPEAETDDGAPGFGGIVALVALVAAALLVVRRRP
jgi:PGF-CTERM protein